jgi:hypothetical protein
MQSLILLESLQFVRKAWLIGQIARAWKSHAIVADHLILLCFTDCGTLAMLRVPSRDGIRKDEKISGGRQWQSKTSRL